MDHRRKGSDVWVWRDDTALGTRGTGSARRGGTAPGWRLDAYGTWTWDEPSLLEREGVGVGALRGDVASRRSGSGRAPAARGAETRAAETTLGGTPIFHALTVDRRRRETLRAVPGPRDRWADDERPRRRADSGPSIPEPHPGSGPLPIQDAEDGRGRRGLAAVPTVPPPPLPGASSAPAGHDDVAESPQDELRRRAERRRRPHRAEEDAEAGRHAMRRPAASGGRHAMH